MTSDARAPRHSSVSNDHGSPPELIEAARATMGSIDLDPATSVIFNRAVRAKRIFRIEDNGLAQVWSGNVWLNPPGGIEPKTRESRQKKWWFTLADRWRKGQIAQACFLGFSIEVLQNTQTDEEDALNPKPLHFPFCVPSSRPIYRKQVLNAQGGIDLVPNPQPTHAGVLVYLPPRAQSDLWQRRFVANFSPHGEIANLRKPFDLGRATEVERL